MSNQRYAPRHPPPRSNYHNVRPRPPPQPQIRSDPPPDTRECHQIHNLRFSDQVYNIFKASGTKKYSLNLLCEQLSHQYPSTIRMHHIDRLPFIQMINIQRNSTEAQLYVHLDDICPSGALCNQRHCNRIHFIANHHLCSHERYRFGCSEDQCEYYLHVPQRRLINNILSVILFELTRFRKQQYIEPLEGFYIARDHFINTYEKLHSDEPHIVPNMDRLQNDIQRRIIWRKMIDTHNTFMGENNNEAIILWETETVFGTQPHRWRLRINQTFDFFAKRTCFADSISTKGCEFCYMKWNFCPYFHLHRTVCNLLCVNRHHCTDCFYGQCRIHFNTKNMPRSIVPISTSFMRSEVTINDEIKSQCMGSASNEQIELLTLDDDEIMQHNEWCNALGRIYETYRGHYDNHDHGDPDKVMDGMFHVMKGSAITMTWDIDMKKEIRVIQLISNIKKIFDTLNQTIDIAIHGLEKYIILNYSISERMYSEFAHGLKLMLLNIPRKWCFNRRISIAINTARSQNNQSIDLIIEFQNVNVFCSVDMIREWFEQLISIYSKTKLNASNNSMQCVRGSYHYIYRTNSVVPLQGNIATVYFKKCNLDLNALRSSCNTMNGKPFVLELADRFMDQNRNGDKRFINYKPPIMWKYLIKHNQMHVHCDQYDTIQRIIKRVESKNVYERNYVQSSEAHPRNSPPPRDINAYATMSINNMENEYQYDEESSVTPVPHNNVEYNHYNGHQNTNGSTYKVYDEENALTPIPQIANDIGPHNGYEAEHMNNNNNEYKHDEESPQTPIPTIECKVNVMNETKYDNDCDYSSDSTDGQCIDDVYRDGVMKVDSIAVLNAKHRAYGNLNNTPYCDENEALNRLCRYCMQSEWTEIHIKECLYMPPQVQAEYLKTHGIDTAAASKSDSDCDSDFITQLFSDFAQLCST